MAEISIVKATPKHLDLLLEDGLAEGRFLAAVDMPAVKQAIRDAADGGLALTGLLDGRPVAMAGLVLRWSGVADGWAYISDRAKLAPKSVVRGFRACIEMLMHKHGIRRIQVTVVSGFRAGRKFARLLGFTEEAYLEEYGPDGSDHIQYVLKLAR